MTIKVKIAPGYVPGLSGIVGTIDALLFDLNVISSSTTLIKLGGSGYAAKVFGTGFSFTTFRGDGFLSGGKVTGIDVNIGGSNAMDFSGMSMKGADLFKAIKAEITGSDAGATEKLFTSESWVISANNADDVLTKATKSADGIKINLKGNDKVALKGGNDKFFSGNGNDKVAGGAGNDLLWGGKGADVLRGGGGRDKLFGEVGNDKLFGDAANDLLVGGGGRDVLVGGKGNDRLKGGSGVDIFKFVGDDIGDDHIIDFDDGVDKISLNFERIEVIKKQGDGVLVEYDGGSIYIDDIIVGAISEADFI